MFNRNQKIKKKKIFIIGAGKHGRMIASSILKDRSLDLVGFIDRKQIKNEKILGKEMFENLEEIKKIKNTYFIIGIGDNRRRAEKLKAIPRSKIITVIDKTAIIDRRTKIEDGCFVAPGVIINFNTHIKKNCIINTGSIIEHDCIIEEDTHICPGVKMAGSIKMGKNTFIGVGSVIIDNITIGDNVIIGAGSVIIDNIPDNATAVGAPAKVIKINGKRI
ncbi:MAG TPA: acetyltransferase [Candidatus Parcubacteria bacterium]|nr:acetyltransferase [Candidatus Parcubacteria bacterium]